MTSIGSFPGGSSGSRAEVASRPSRRTAGSRKSLNHSTLSVKGVNQSRQRLFRRQSRTRRPAFAKSTYLYNPGRKVIAFASIPQATMTASSAGLAW